MPLHPSLAADVNYIDVQQNEHARGSYSLMVAYFFETYRKYLPMKNCIYITTLIMIVGVASAFAQQDSAHLQPPQRPDPNVPTSTQPSIPQTNDYNSTDPLIRIRLDAVPSSLKRNLRGSQYEG